MTTMVEGVIDAIRRQVREQAEVNGEWCVAYDGEDEVTLDGTININLIARAAIEAMREPSTAMDLAGRKAIDDSMIWEDGEFQFMELEAVKKIIVAIVAAALKEGT